MTPESIHRIWQDKSRIDSNILFPEVAAATQIMIEELQDRLLTIDRVLHSRGRKLFPDIDTFIMLAQNNLDILLRTLPASLGRYPESEYPETLRYANDQFAQILTSVDELEKSFGIQKQDQTQEFKRS